MPSIISPFHGVPSPCYIEAPRIFEHRQQQDEEGAMSRQSSMVRMVEERPFDPDLACMVADYMDAKVAQRFGGRIKRSEAVSAGLRFVARRFAVSYTRDSDLTGVEADLLEWLDQMIAEEHSRKQLAPGSIANGSWSIWRILLSATGLLGAVWLVTVSIKSIWIGIIGSLVCLALPGGLLLWQWLVPRRDRYRQ
jgi:hypothetical protein